MFKFKLKNAVSPNFCNRIILLRVILYKVLATTNPINLKDGEHNQTSLKFCFKLCLSLNTLS